MPSRYLPLECLQDGEYVIVSLGVETLTLRPEAALKISERIRQCALQIERMQHGEERKMG
jgi:hypothetical protein